MNVVKCLALALALAAGARALAGPAEDYAAGLRAYRVGDVKSAISILRKPADAGDAASQTLLARILDGAEANAEALKYYRMAAAQGEAEASYGLAVMLAGGEAGPPDPRGAREAMLAAARRGHGPAVNAIALSYLKGGLGTAEADRKSPEALLWIEKAADNGLLPAIDRLALAYREGELGLARDPARAEALEARAREIRGIRLTPAKKTKKTHG